MSNELELTGEFAPASRDMWLRLVEKALKGADFEKRLVQRTADGIRIDPLYARDRAIPGNDTALPGTAPFTRGTGTANWQMRQPCVETDPVAARAVIAEDFAAGADSMEIRIEAAGQAGLPPTADALAAALTGIPLDKVTISLSAGESARLAAEGLAALWSRSGTPAFEWRAAINLDPIGDLARLGGASMKLETAVAEAARFAADPRWHDGQVSVLVADGRIYHEAGASEAQELAGLASTLVAYLRAMAVVGAKPAGALARISIGLSTDADLFMSIAKLRAARRIVWRIADAAGAGSVAASCRMAVTTSARMMARRDPWVNMLRTCAAGMAGALGGADALTILPYTWALGKPDDFARRIARNMHVVLKEESGLGRVADPAGGSWYLESLTEELAQKAWTEFQEIEAQGGIIAALRNGFVCDRIATVAAERARSIATGRAALTGVSAFPRLGDDGVRVEPMPAPRTGPGAAERVPALSPIRLGAAFEALRDKADAFATATGRQPRVFLASLGSTGEHSARSTWIANFLAAGGIAVIAGEGFTSSADVGRSFADSGARVACICSSDTVYAELAEATAGVLKQAGASRVLLAGRPKNEAELKAAGVDAFLYAGQDAVAALSALQAHLGVD
jgi:methylmalonyl-CoA mutase